MRSFRGFAGVFIGAAILGMVGASGAAATTTLGQLAQQRAWAPAAPSTG